MSGDANNSCALDEAKARLLASANGENQMTMGRNVFVSMEDLRLSLTALQAREEADGVGWVYFGPDVGTEYAPDHPVDSGEMPDATDVRRSTSFEDWLVGQLQASEARANTLQSALAEALGTIQGLIYGLPDLLASGDLVDEEGLIARAAEVHSRLTNGEGGGA